MIKQKMMELGLPEHMWDLYGTAVPVDVEIPPEPLVNGHKPSTGTPCVFEEMDHPSEQVEAYC